MQGFNRKTVTRISALVLVLMLLTSFTASFAAASFTKSGAGVKYNGTFKLGATVTSKALKKAFGNYTRKIDPGCTFGYATYLYIFKSKGVQVETLQKKKNGPEQIITIKVTSSKVPTIAGLKVGNKNSKIASKYGKKCEISGSTVRYKAGSYYLYVYTRNKKVTSYAFIWDL